MNTLHITGGGPFFDYMPQHCFAQTFERGEGEVDSAGFIAADLGTFSQEHGFDVLHNLLAEHVRSICQRASMRDCDAEHQLKVHQPAAHLNFELFHYHPSFVLSTEPEQVVGS